MKVRLLKTIIEGGGVKASIRAGGAKVTPFVEGAVIEMSDASAAKWIKRGDAEPFVEEPAE